MFKLEHKVGVTLVLVFLAIFAAQLFTRVYWVLPEMYKLEALSDQKDKKRFLSALDSVIERLVIVNYDNAVWEQMYDFLNNPSSDFMTTTYNNKDMYETSGANGIVLFNDVGKLVWHIAKSGEDGLDIELSWDYTKPGHPFEEVVITPAQVHNNNKRPLTNSGILRTSMGVVIFAATSVVHNDLELGSNGTLIYWRFWDDEINKRIADVSNLQFTAIPLANRNASPLAMKLARNSLRDSDDNLVFLVNDPAGAPVVRVSIQLPQRVFSTNWLEPYFLAGILVALFALLALRIFINRVLLHPIDSIRSHMLQIRKSTNFKNRIDLGRTDELGILCKEYDRLLDHIALQEKSLKELNTHLQKASDTDALTRIANRRKFDTFLQESWNDAKERESSLALIMCDVDFFKPFNDNYGHLRGDQVLTAIASCLDKHLHLATDLVARYGGEEFAIVLTQTEINGAVRVAEALRSAVEKMNLPHSYSKCADVVTISMGIAVFYPNDNNNLKQLIDEADKALYAAKSQGRNCCKLLDSIE